MDSQIRINNSKESEQEFDVNIQGLPNAEDEKGAQIRFVILNVNGGDLSLRCERREGSKWFVKIPALPMLKAATPFRIEMIIDGYYFEPATGTVIPFRDPEIKVANSAKPKVSVAILSSEKDTDKDDKDASKDDSTTTEPKEEKKVEEMSGGGGYQVDGPGVAQNAKLLKPEFPPDNDVEGDERARLAPRARPEDEDTDESKIEPGKFTEVDDDPERGKVEETTILGKHKKPSKPGFLFNRTTDGKAVIEGLEPDAETKSKLARKQALVQQVLSETKKRKS